MPSKNVSGYNVLNFPPILKGYRYKRRWTTNVMSTLDGDETRTNINEDIVKSLQCTILLEDYEEIMALKKILYFSLNKSYAVPLWHYRMTATSVAGTNITTDTTDVELEAGDSVLLTDRTWNNYEKQVVDSVSDSSITTTTTCSGGWGNGTTVYPLLIAEVDDVQSVAPGFGNNIDLMTISMQFTETFRMGEP